MPSLQTDRSHTSVVLQPMRIRTPDELFSLARSEQYPQVGNKGSEQIGSGSRTAAAQLRGRLAEGCGSASVRQLSGLVYGCRMGALSARLPHVPAQCHLSSRRIRTCTVPTVLAAWIERAAIATTAAGLLTG